MQNGEKKHKKHNNKQLIKMVGEGGGDLLCSRLDLSLYYACILSRTASAFSIPHI